MTFIIIYRGKALIGAIVSTRQNELERRNSIRGIVELAELLIRHFEAHEDFSNVNF